MRRLSTFRLILVQICTTLEEVRASEFLRRVKKLARNSGVSCRFVAGHGKGSHGTLYYGGRLTTLQDLSRELPTGTLHAMLKHLGLKLEDIQ
jgi:mRNA interferase HicA